MLRSSSAAVAQDISVLCVSVFVGFGSEDGVLSASEIKSYRRRRSARRETSRGSDGCSTKRVADG